MAKKAKKERKKWWKDSATFTASDMFEVKIEKTDLYKNGVGKQIVLCGTGVDMQNVVLNLEIAGLTPAWGVWFEEKSIYEIRFRMDFEAGDTYTAIKTGVIA